MIIIIHKNFRGSFYPSPARKYQYKVNTQKQPPDVFIKNEFLKISQNSQENRRNF